MRAKPKFKPAVLRKVDAKFLRGKGIANGAEAQIHREGASQPRVTRTKVTGGNMRIVDAPDDDQPEAA